MMNWEKIEIFLFMIYLNFVLKLYYRVKYFIYLILFVLCLKRLEIRVLNRYDI